MLEQGVASAPLKSLTRKFGFTGAAVIAQAPPQGMAVARKCRK